MLNRLPRSFLRGPSWFQVRTFLSEAYKLSESWNTRLSSPILQKVNVDNFFYELDQKFTQNKGLNAIDVDIFANKISSESHIDELTDLIGNLRKTEEASNILDSTGHALVRLLLESNQIDHLIAVLDNRLDYGIFLDDYTTSLILNTLLKNDQVKEAARIVTIHMLQEDTASPITKNLALLACLKHLNKFELFDDLKPAEEQVVEPGQKKKKITEQKVRVKFLRNPFFDDHFDVRDSQLLLGKAFVYLGKQTSGSLGLNIKLLGLGIYRKFDQAIELIDASKGQDIFKYTLEKINSTLNDVEADGLDAFKSKLDLVGSTHKIIDFDVEKEVTDECKKSVSEYEQSEIDSQNKVYSAWIDIRQKKLNEEYERLRRAERVKEVEKLKKELKMEEQKLWFFENEQNLDLKIEEKRVFYPKRWFKNKKKPRQVDTNYIPPDVDRRRNV